MRRRAVLDGSSGSDNSIDNLDHEGRLRPRRRWIWSAAIALLILVLLAAVGLFAARRHYENVMQANLPKLDGQIILYGLRSPVTVQRDAHGVPHISASSMDDLVMAQGYITAADRLWQMDLLRRHAAGELAAILGQSMLEHDRLQRTLQLRAAADRAIAALPADQKHWLEMYARGVNSAIVEQRSHLPLEFKLLGYEPAPWTPRDSLLVELAMYQDLTTQFPVKLGREQLAAHLPAGLIADLYPTGSWRDHPPGQPLPDVTAPQPEMKDVPPDESQTKLHRPEHAGTASAADLLAVEQTLALLRPCQTCVAGSNAWAVSGAHTASGKPMLSNDMHLNLSVPTIWYEADLQATNPAPMAPFHASGVTLPGAPFVVVGHNDHVAWGFTNLGADVQDLYIEHTRGTTQGAQYQAPDGTWRAILYHHEVIPVRGGASVTLDVPMTHHGNMDTPVISSIFPGELRSLSLAWTIYDPANVTVPFFAVDSASDWASMQVAFSTWGGPPQNMIYADDEGHIGYHAVGRIPVRGDLNNPSPLSPVPTDAVASDAALHEWAGYIPFDQLPQAFDPIDGVLATANARITPDGYRYPITLNWMAPYRTERIYKILEGNNGKSSMPGVDTGKGPAMAPAHPLTPGDMLALQNDVYSELDKVIAQRLAYSIDHAQGPLKDDKTLHQAADILRRWNGSVDADATAPAIVDAARNAFWPMLLIPKLAPQFAAQLAEGKDLSKLKGLPRDVAETGNLWQMYSWGERDSVEEELISNAPARWLSEPYKTWDDFLAAVTKRGLRDAHAPADLNAWHMGQAFPLDIEHPVISRSGLAKLLVPRPTGTGEQAQSGDLTCVKQVGHAFGPSERLTVDMSDPNRTTLNIVLGQSGNPASPWFMDQFQDWLHGRTYPMPFSGNSWQSSHTLTLLPR